MTTVRRVLRSPWLWAPVGLVLAFLPHVVFLVYVLLSYAALNFYFFRKYCRRWKTTGQINHRWFTLRRRWTAWVFVWGYAFFGTVAVILALYAVIVGNRTD